MVPFPPAGALRGLLLRRATLALLAVDAGLIGLDLGLTGLAALEAIPAVPHALRLEGERNLAALWNLLQWAALAGLCARAALRGGGALPAALAAAFAMLLADDALELHERLGHALALTLSLPAPPHLRAQDLGELMVVAVECALLALALIWAWRRRRPGDAGRLAVFVALFALLGLTGVVLAMAHIALGRWPLLHALIGAAEDGGELVAASLMLAYAWAIYGPDPSPAPRPQA